MFQNRATRLLYHLHCSDHVTVHYRSAKWLPFSQLVKYHSVYIMFYQYHHDYGRGIPLEPPIQFGKVSKYHTRTKENFAQPCTEMSLVICSVIFFATEVHSIRTPYQQTLRIMYNLMILRRVCKLTFYLSCNKVANFVLLCLLT